VENGWQAQRKVFESLGCVVRIAEPDFLDANEYFLGGGTGSTELGLGDSAAHGIKMNESIHWHVLKRTQLTGPHLLVIRGRAQCATPPQRLCNFEGKYEYFVLPVNQVLPVDA